MPTKDSLPNVPALLEKSVENFRIDSAFLRMKSRDAAENPGAAEVLSDASQKIARLAESFERMKRAFERKETPAGVVR